MANVTSGPRGENPRPEDATTLEEFQARYDAEMARIGTVYGSRRQRIRLAGAIVALIPCGLLWAWFWQYSGGARWGILALALAYTYVVVRVANRFDGTTRRRELDRLSEQWQARAKADQVPRPAP
jgi:hypothetical protein